MANHIQPICKHLSPRQTKIFISLEIPQIFPRRKPDKTFANIKINETPWNCGSLKIKRDLSGRGRKKILVGETLIKII